uniref:GOLD domain-containing protein n=1 Tax=Astyanax mexicanus TaxID=7994 RepID=A0A3B1K104_ASTMX
FSVSSALRALTAAAALLALSAAAAAAFSPGADSELTFVLPAGHTECFYQSAARNGTMEVEYQVRGSGVCILVQIRLNLLSHCSKPG